ncbi:CehA/McbA family metallohydrolase [Aestuariibaculum sediminum]|uniref:CehA/McbA family metallohydrolase n=1 Tax=Aestuariibaculum sediminum TaxID=2770637 RepID=A0A8J6PZJ1_9FLAO|nr:CehA/McbA family metallohydrolase [Aestuariibaculum sediminum]MBD0831607.1 CehA/McbA family metallohydrolase [Aestuariibaculum sediminum]
MKNLVVIFSLLLLISNAVNAQWTNRYPKVDGYGHHVYLEGYELPVLNTGPTDPAPSPTKNQVAFSAKGWLWLLNLETGHAKRITTSSGMDFKPNWSPDGTKIVFVRDDSSDTNLVLLDLNSMTETPLVNTNALDLDPIFSADGNFIYYASAKNGSFDLWKINIQTKESALLTTENSLERLPIPTHKGNQIVYLHKTGFSYDSVKLLDIETNSSTTLVQENFMSQIAFSLSKDNTTLAYTWPHGDGYELRLLNINIPESNMFLTKSNGLPLSPKFSYDGNWVYFSENNNNQVSEIKRISVNGGSPELLSISKWDWGTPTGKLKITSRVDGKKDAVRMSITDNNGHPIIPESGMIHSEGQHGIVFFYSPGEIEIEAPVGLINIHVVRGFSTVEHVQKTKLKAGTTSVDLNLERIWDANKAGWYALDNHFHLNYGGTNQLAPEDILLDLKAEDIDVAFPLVANLGNRFLEQDLFGWENEAKPLISFGQEVRSHFFGHLNLIKTKSLFWPWVWGPRYDIYKTDDRPNAEALRFARKQGGLGGYVHPVSIKDPFKEGGAKTIPVGFVADAVLGEVDILELGCLWTDEIGTAALWHEILNLGIPMALSAGSDVMNNMYRTMAIGATRLYIKPDENLTLSNCLNAIKNGKSFISNGPQLLLTLENNEVGDVVNIKKNKAKWKAVVHSPVPYESIEIFVNGLVVDTKKSKRGNTQTYSGTINIPKGGWVTARVSGNASKWPMMDSYAFAETSPIWFHQKGSTVPEAKMQAAKKLLKILNVSEETMKQGYGDSKIPHLLDHFSKARLKLENIISESKNN